MNERKPQLYFLLAALVGISILVFLIFRPFLYALALAMVFATVLQPVYKKIVKFTRGWRDLSALITILIVVVLIFTPLVFLGIRIFQETQQPYFTLTTAIQSIFMYRTNIKKRAEEKKIPEMDKRAYIKIAVIQDFTNPARLGLLLGASLAPIAGIAGALSGFMHNGWILAIIGSTESIVAGLTVTFAGTINEWRFRRKLKQFPLRRI